MEEIFNTKTYVYVAEIGEEIGDALYPPQRMQEVLACTNEQVKRQRYYAWKLLEYGLQHAFNQPISKLTFEKTKGGKWTSNEYCFSISHSGKVVAVALSKTPIGVDVELLRSDKNDFIQKLLTEREKRELSTLSEEDKTEFLIGKWTEKESVFKAFLEGRFQPSQIQTYDYEIKSKKLFINEQTYILSVAGTELEALHIQGANNDF